MALIHNTNCKKSDQVKPDDFNPYADRVEPKSNVKIEDLKPLFESFGDRR